jgi:hypothetical protein
LRRQPDGSPFFTQNEAELRFETWIGGRKVTAKFRAVKLKYKGKLEI